MVSPMIIGIIGLGEMGGGFADRLLAAGHPVVGWNRTRSKAEPFIAKGLRWASSPRAVTEAADAVLTMVTNDAARDAGALGDHGLLAAIADKIWIEMSTISPARAVALAETTRAAGGTLLDAPVLGSQVTLAQGKLLIMVGGDPVALARVRPSLEAIIDLRHPLAVLAGKIDWAFLETRLGAVYKPGVGHPPLPVRLMAHLLILKQMQSLSNEVLCERWVENEPLFPAFLRRRGVPARPQLGWRCGRSGSPRPRG